MFTSKNVLLYINKQRHDCYIYTGCTLKLRAVSGRLSYILWKNGRFLVDIGRFRTDFWPEVVQMTFHNDVFSIFIIKDCIYIEGKLVFAKISAQNSEIRHNFAWITFLPLWTVKLLFVIFGRLSYTFLQEKICNLSVKPVYIYILYEQKHNHASKLNRSSFGQSLWTWMMTKQRLVFQMSTRWDT